MKLQMKQLQMAKFEYEVKGKSLNLYDRIDDKKGKDILRFLAQIPFKKNLEFSVKNAVEKVYDKISTPQEMRIFVSDLNLKGKEIDYIRKNYQEEFEFWKNYKPLEYS